MATGDIHWHITGLDSIERRLTSIEGTLNAMAVDQGTFDAALADFLADLSAGLAAIQAKLDAAGTTVDLSAELDQITAAKVAFDAQVAADTPPSAAPAEVAPAEPVVAADAPAVDPAGEVPPADPPA